MPTAITIASNRKCVLPTLTMSPSVSIRSPSMRMPFTLVPLVEPRSTMTILAARGRISA